MRLIAMDRRALAVTVIAAAVVSACTSSPTTLSVGAPDSQPTPAHRGAAPAAVIRAVEGAWTDGTVRGPVRWIRTTEQAAAPLDHAGPGAGDTPIYVIELHGHWVLDSAPRPATRVHGKLVVPESPEGTVMILFVPVTPDPGRGGWGVWLSDRAVDLSPYGTVHTIATAPSPSPSERP